MQTYTFQLTGIKDGKPRSLYVTTTAHPDIVSQYPLLQAAQRARRIYREVFGNESFTDLYIGDAERWFALMNDPYITSEDHDWLHSVENAYLWGHFSG